MRVEILDTATSVDKGRSRASNANLTTEVLFRAVGLFARLVTTTQITAYMPEREMEEIAVTVLCLAAKQEVGWSPREKDSDQAKVRVPMVKVKRWEMEVLAAVGFSAMFPSGMGRWAGNVTWSPHQTGEPVSGEPVSGEPAPR
jgi:hypothetical protein